MSQTIFVSYRRDDAGGHAGRLFDRLCRCFGQEALFYDREHIAAGERFPDRIRDGMAGAAVVLVLIGPDWVTELNKRAQRPEVDYVRREVELALERAAAGAGPRIIPVMLNGAEPPSARDLDASLRSTIEPLCLLQGLIFEGTNDDWNEKFTQLVAAIGSVPGVRAFRQGGGGPVPTPPLRRTEHVIVGIEKVVETFIAQLAQTRDFAFVQMPGVGKTTVAEQLVRNPQVMARFPDGALWADVGEAPDAQRPVRILSTWARLLGVEKSEIELRHSVAELSELVASALTDRAMLLVVDDVWSVAAARPFRVGGEACVQVVTTRRSDVAGQLVSDAGVIQVKPLDADDGFRLLADIAPRAAEIEPDSLRRLAAQAAGLPIAIYLIGKMLNSVAKNDGRIRRTIDSLDGLDSIIEDERLTAVVDASCKALGQSWKDGHAESPQRGDLLRSAVEALSVVRPEPAWFDRAVALRLSAAGETTIDEWLDALCDAGLIEELVAPDRAGLDPNEDEPDESDRRFTMHRVIADHLRKRLSPDGIDALNRCAAEHFLDALRRLEEGYRQRGGYAAWFRYEHPRWTETEERWLYHVRQVGGRAADLAFLRAWFDGFWWWECFIDQGYGFCDRLLGVAVESLRHRAPGAGREPGLDVVSRLRDFKAAYPKESEGRRGGSWPEVAATLADVRRHAEIDGDDIEGLSDAGRHLRAVTDLFLAEAARYRVPPDESSIETHQQEALALFGREKDDWNIVWTRYHRADSRLDLGRPGEARQLAREVLADAKALDDPEVIAHLHRVFGDAAVAAGDIGEAVADYGCAVEEAYRFQVEPEPLDAYTVAFYAMLVNQAAAGLARAGAWSVPAGRAGLIEMRRRWAADDAEAGQPPADEAGSVEPDARALAVLFPPALALPQLDAEGAAYADRVQAHLATLRRNGRLPRAGAAPAG